MPTEKSFHKIGIFGFEPTPGGVGFQILNSLEIDKIIVLIWTKLEY